jgi:hypothetical protein
MVVVPLPKQSKNPQMRPCAGPCECTNWAAIAAGTTLIAGGLLFLAGKRRAATVAAASGTALAMLDQQEVLRAWWLALPGHIDEVQNVLNKVQDAVNDVAIKHEKLSQILHSKVG